MAVAWRRWGRGGRLAALLVVLSTLGAVGAVHPAAPWAAYRADVALGSGHPGLAAQRYEAILRVRSDPAVQRRVRQRLAHVYATQLDRPIEARRHLDALLALPGLDGAERSELLARVGELLLVEGHPEGAATRIEAAAHAHEGPLRAPYLLRAADILAGSGRMAAAETLYRRVARDHAAWQGHATLGMAQLALRKGQPGRALGRFESALAHTYDPDVAEVARLGRTICLERLGDLDSALAELEEVDGLSETAREARAESMRRRHRATDDEPS